MNLRSKYSKTKIQHAKLRGQAIVEVALSSVFLLLLIAVAVDFGRAAYTSIVVTNMAGEGAAYASLYPYRDSSGSNSCEVISSYSTIQSRVRTVAQEHGLAIKQDNITSADIQVMTDTAAGTSNSCSDRCVGHNITVKVTYRLDSMFLPGFLGMRSITITKDASAPITGGNSCN